MEYYTAKKRLSPRASNTTVQKGDCRHTRARLSLSANVSSMLTTLALTAGTLAAGAALSARAAQAAGTALTARAALATGTLGSALSLLRFLLSLLSPARRAAARRSAETDFLLLLVPLDDTLSSLDTLRSRLSFSLVSSSIGRHRRSDPAAT